MGERPGQRLTLRPALTRQEAVDHFCGSLKGYLKPGERDALEEEAA